MSVDYFRTLIAVADDCPVEVSRVPQPRAGKPTAATLQYEMLAAHPGELTSQDVLFDSWLARQPGDKPAAEVERLRKQFWSKPQACLRSSPLPKQFGFGLLFDQRGRITLVPRESDRYAALLVDAEVTVRKALRSRA